MRDGTPANGVNEHTSWLVSRWPYCQDAGWGGQKDSKTVTPSVWSELLLQIDALAMSGAIKAVEAKSLRRLVISRDLEAAEHFSKLSSQTIVGKDLARGLLALLDPNYR